METQSILGLNARIARTEKLVLNIKFIDMIGEKSCT